LEKSSDLVFRGLTYVFAWATVLVVLFLVFRVGKESLPAIKSHGLPFLYQAAWNPGKETYGILPQIWGTIYSSVLALIFGSLFGLAVAVFLSERFLSSFVFRILSLFGLQFRPFWRDLPDRLEVLLKNLIELLAAIPSVVYGFWGLLVLVPLIQPGCDWLYAKLNWIPLFSTHLARQGLLPAAIVLSIMILPTISAISRDALATVPPKLREAAYGLGATRWETLLAVMLPTAKSGIFGAIILAFGRALGETMAIAMLAGGGKKISVSLFSPIDTLSALLANSFSDPDEKIIAVLMYAALVLMAITLAVNMFGAMILQRSTAGMKGGR